MIAVRICILSLAGLLALSVGPAVAAKPGCGAGPTVPGGSEIDQYAQFIPGSCGSQENGSNSAGGGGGAPGGGDSTGGGEGSGSAASVISPSTGERLQGLGADGAATQALAESNAPRIRENGDGQAAKGSDGSQGGQSGAGGALDALLGSDDGGMGIGLPLILLAVAAGGVLFVVRRRASHAS